MTKKKFLSEFKAIIFIVLSVLTIKVTILESYIVQTGSMENTIMTGDFLIGTRFVYGMRTPDWIGIPYTDIGFSIPYYKFPEFKIPKVGDVLIFKFPRDVYVKYVKRCVAGPGDSLEIKAKKLFVNGENIPMWEHGKFKDRVMPESAKFPDIFLSSDENINRDYLGPIYVPKKGDIFEINDDTNWELLIQLLIMEGNRVSLIDKSGKEFLFTIQDPIQIIRRKGDRDVYKKYYPDGELINPWKTIFQKENNNLIHINGKPISSFNSYELTQNYYWVMGDNRDDSLDSRYWGFVPENHILGEAIYTYFSIDLDTYIPRWSRIGTVLK